MTPLEGIRKNCLYRFGLLMGGLALAPQNSQEFAESSWYKFGEKK